uniref:(northern house mosquito) hypothetical protein n=1 Tax=Culex pipiens TaxID=7175 RepID=A0A8D8AVD0_CULPI
MIPPQVPPRENRVVLRRCLAAGVIFATGVTSLLVLRSHPEYPFRPICKIFLTNRGGLTSSSRPIFFIGGSKLTPELVTCELRYFFRQTFFFEIVLRFLGHGVVVLELVQDANLEQNRQLCWWKTLFVGETAVKIFGAQSMMPLLQLFTPITPERTSMYT